MLRWQLAANHPAAFNPDLAMSLHNLGIYLSRVGRREYSLLAFEEAVELYQQLAVELYQQLAVDDTAFNLKLENTLSLCKAVSELGLT